MNSKRKVKRMASGKAIEVNEEKSFFQLLFLKDDTAQRIQVKEINFKEVEKHLERGEAVFIRPNRCQKPNVHLSANERTADPWYFCHV